MKHTGLAFLFLLFLIHDPLQGQNLILNPGLEKYSTRPGFGRFGSTWVDDWPKPSLGSSGYYRYNCPGISPSVQFPHSDRAEAGIILFNIGTEYREYITATLSQPLTAGNSYYVDFYVDLSPGYIQAVKEAGAYLSDSIHSFFSNALIINVNPQIKNSREFLTYGWTKISGTFIAAGGENYITIGNFNTDANTTAMVASTGSYGSYYFVDDEFVRVADNAPSGIEITTAVNVPLFPDPVRVSEPLFLTIPLYERLESLLYDVTGKSIRTFELNEALHAINLKGMAPGFYLYLFKSQIKLAARGKLVIE